MGLGEVLHQLRLERDLTLREVAEGTGLANGHLSLIEHGRVKSPSPKTLHKIANFYGYSYNKLLELAEHPVVPSGIPPQVFGMATNPASNAVQPELEALEAVRRFRDREIEDLAKALLRDCRINAPPTDPLQVLSSLSLDLFSLEHLTFMGQPTTQVLQQINQLKSKALAILDRRYRRVYVRANLVGPWRNRVILHEVAHFTIPWQKDLFSTCLQTDLSPTISRTLEMEANLFADEIIFHGERFSQEAASHTDVTIAVIEHLAASYGASLEATAWRFVQNHFRPCAMMLSVPTDPNESDIPSLKVEFFRPSLKFRWPELIPIGHRLDPHNPIVKLFYEESDNCPLQQEFRRRIPGSSRGRVVLSTESIATPHYVVTIIREKEIEL